VSALILMLFKAAAPALIIAAYVVVSVFQYRFTAKRNA